MAHVRGTATSPCGGAGTAAPPPLAARTPGRAPLLPAIHACIYSRMAQANKQSAAHLVEASRARCKASYLALAAKQGSIKQVASREDEGNEDGVVAAGSFYADAVQLPHEAAEFRGLAWRWPWLRGHHPIFHETTTEA
jgi:hypothetical protein